MEAKRQELHELIDQLPDEEAHAARRYLEYLRDRGLPGLSELLGTAEEDEALTAEGRRRLEEGLDDVRAGRTLSDQEARRELGW